MKNNTDQIILRILDEALSDESVRASIDTIARRVDQKLSDSSDDALVWEPVPLGLYSEELPEIIRSSWVFVIRANTNTGAERHSNSHQFMMSYEGQGDIQVKRGDHWFSNRLVSVLGNTLEKRWVSIPPGIWHRVVTDESNWTVVSFHTVPADELIEERPDTSGTDAVHQRHYLSQKDKDVK
jgi:hypothetical protein